MASAKRRAATSAAERVGGINAPHEPRKKTALVARACGAKDFVRPAPPEGKFGSVQPPTVPIIALGGSAGSFKALQEFFRAMPSDCGLAFVIITHLAPNRPSTLPNIVQRWTRMRVVQAQNRQKIEPNCVYTIPSGRFLRFSDTSFRLAPFQARPGVRRAIDVFFSSLAEIRGHTAVAVLFSGADTDGAAGIFEIKEGGGLTIVQKPEEATHPFMPETAISTGKVDYILPVARIPAKLLEHFPNRRQSSPRQPSVEELEQVAREDNKSLPEILSLLREQTGYDFTHYRQPGLLRRLSRRMQATRTETLADYHDFLKSQPAEAAALVQDFLISLTWFFRDSAAFQALERALPELFEGKRDRDLVRVWVPGCATGEEVFSIAMLMREHAQKLKAPPNIQIFGTDLDVTAIQFARAGVYPETISQRVEPQRLERFFTREARGYRVRRELREMVLFAVHNILKDPPFAQMDLVSCRNVLIYLSTESQKRVLELLCFALRPEKLLFLGPAERVEGKSSLFEVFDKKHRIYQRRAGRCAGPTTLDTDTLKRTLELRKEISQPVLPARTFAKAVPKKASRPKASPRRHGEDVSGLQALLEQTLKEHEASAAELMASNQELQAINDELRSTSEELDVSRQEMQSVNEELSAVNQELSINLEDLNRVNSDLQNFMNATAIPTVFLDRELQIMRYTPTAVELFKLIPSDVGRPLSDLQDRLEYSGMMKDAKHVLADAQPIEREVCERDGARWFLARVLPYRAPEEQIAGVVLAFVDITERKRAEERQGFLLKLADALRPLSDPEDVKSAAVHLLGEQLRVNRAFYAEVRGDDWIVAKGYEHDVAALPDGAYAAATYGHWIMETYRAGGRIIIRDLRSDDRFASTEQEAHVRIGIISAVGVPLVKSGNLVAILAVHSAEPHDWSEHEIALVEETAERTWAAVERARAEARLARSEEKYRALFESIDEGFCIIEVFFDENHNSVDYRFLQINPVFERQTGIKNAVGRRMREVAPLHEEHWFKIYGDVALTGKPKRFENPAAQLGRWYDVYAFRVGDPQLRQVGILFNDITERKRAEDALREIREELEAEVSALARLHEASTRLWRTADLRSGLEEILDAAIALLGADMGNVQLLNPVTRNLEIVVQRGFQPAFLEFFREVTTEHDSACGRSLRSGKSIMIEDVETDVDYAPYRDVAAAAGYRAVQSTPLLGQNGEPFGMLSTHFRNPHRPTEQDWRRLDLYVHRAADFIERQRKTRRGSRD